MRLPLDHPIAYLAVAFSIVFFLLHEFLTQPPDVVSKSSDPSVFSAERAKTYLDDILQRGNPHPVGSEENRFVRQRIEHHLNAFSLPYEIQKAWSCRQRSNICGEVENIVAIIPGREQQGVVVLMAHYDSVPTSVGAGDDGAGVAAILESARALSMEQPLTRSVVLLFSDGEENGLLGAEAFFSSPRFNDESLDISTVLNFEGSGTKGLSRVLRTSGENEALMARYSESARPATGNSLSNEIFKIMPNDTDFSAVSRNGYRGIDFAFANERNHYHTANDNLSNLDVRTLQHHGNNMLPLVRSILHESIVENSDLTSVYADPYGIWLQWSIDFQLVLIFITLVLLLIGLHQHSRHSSSVTILAATVIQGLVLVVSLAVGYFVFEILDSLVNGIPYWPANIIGHRILVIAAPLFAAVSVLVLVERVYSVKQSDLIFGAAIWLFLLALFLNFNAPEAAPLWVASSMGISLCLAAATFAGARLKPAAQLTTLFFVVPASLALIPPIEASQGYGVVLGILVGSCLFMMFIAAFLSAELRASLLLSAAGLVIGMVLVLVLPKYSEWRPQHVNLALVEDQQNDTAYFGFWSPQPIKSPQRSLQRIKSKSPQRVGSKNKHNFSIEPFKFAPFLSPRYTPWSPSSHRLGKPVDYQIDASALKDGFKTVSVSLDSHSELAKIQFFFPTATNLQAFEIEDEHFEAKRSKREFDSVQIVGTYERSIRITFHFQTTDPIHGYLASQFASFPESLAHYRPQPGTAVHQGDLALSFTPLQL